jgi:hypothetical protein
MWLAIAIRNFRIERSRVISENPCNDAESGASSDRC